MSDEESYEYEYDDDDMDEGGFQYSDDEEVANDGEVALGMLKNPTVKYVSKIIGVVGFECLVFPPTDAM